MFKPSSKEPETQTPTFAAFSASHKVSPTPLHSLPHINMPLAPSSDEDCWSLSGLSIALAHWFFRNENMLDFLLATQHHSSLSTLSPVAGTGIMEGTFPGIPCQQVCTWDLPMKGTHIRSGKQKRSRRPIVLLCTSGQTHGLQ